MELQYNPNKSLNHISRYLADLEISAEIPIVVLICITYTIITLLIIRYCTTINQSGTDVPWFHPSSVAALIGLLIGGITSSFNIVIKFNDDIFFYVVLPPIIFTAGYTLKKKKFFQYLHYIALYGIVGSLLNFIVLALAAFYYKRVSLTWEQSLLLSSVLAASDEISAISLIKQSEFPRLGALIFGEGVLNDAISIVLFQALLSNYRNSLKKVKTEMDDQPTSFALSLVTSVAFQLAASIFIGVLCGLCNARILKVCQFSRKYPIHQVTLVILTGYLAYSVAEAFSVSGILTLFVASVTLAHYSWHSLSKSAKLASQIALVSLSDVAEGFAFAYVGLSLWNVAKGPVNIAFSMYMLLMVIMARFATIVVLDRIYNMLTISKVTTLESAKTTDIASSVVVTSATIQPLEVKTIPFFELIAFGLGGVVRGCLCWAQVLQIGNGDDAQLLIQTTLVIVMATTVGCGFVLPLIIPRLTDILKDSKTKFGRTDSNIGRNSTPIRHNTAMKNSNRDNNDDDVFSTYSMHLEGSINSDDDEEKYYMTSPPPKNLWESLNSTEMKTKNSDSSQLLPTTTPPHDKRGSEPERIGYQSISYSSGYKDQNMSLAFASNEPNQMLSSATKHKLRYHKSLQKYSLLFILWIRIDEQYLKPLFGGSTIAPKKQKALSLTKSMKAYEMLSPMRTIAVETDETGDDDDEDDTKEERLEGEHITADIETEPHRRRSLSFPIEHNLSNGLQQNYGSTETTKMTLDFDRGSLNELGAMSLIHHMTQEDTASTRESTFVTPRESSLRVTSLSDSGDDNRSCNISKRPRLSLNSQSEETESLLMK